MTHLLLPPPRGNLAVPASDRRSFLAGLSLWSPSRFSARILKFAYSLAGGSLGPGRIPGLRAPWAPPMASETLAAHEVEWRRWFGPFDEVAGFRPTQSERKGYAVLLLSDGVARGFVKVRPGWDASAEAAALARVAGAETFWAPEVIGCHSAHGWTSLGTSPLRSGLHSPLISAPIGAICSEVSTLLNGLSAPTVEGWEPMHGDMGPWNLRQLKGHRPALFDWEHARPAPSGADLVFYTIATRAVGLRTTTDLRPFVQARSYWAEEIPLRFGSNPRDTRLAQRMLRLLERYH